MPVIIAIAIRYVIMAAIQLGLWAVLEKYAIPLLNNAIINTMEFFGVNEETAKDIMANRLIKGAEEIGVFAATLRTKLPIKVAEMLGFTSKGFAIRKLEATLATKIEQTALKSGVNALVTDGEVKAMAKVIAKARGISLDWVLKVGALISLAIGVPTGFFYAFAQYVDYANWQGPYQKYFQKVLSYFGINPDTVIPRAKTISAETWKRVYATIEELHPIGISFPFSGKDTPWSRQNFADLVDEVAANLVKAGGQASYKNVIGAVLPLVQLSGAPATPSEEGTLGTTTSSQTYTPTIKVVTGTIAQSTLAAALPFVPRQDDMIENMGELVQAVRNNEAPFLASLGGRIIREIKIVSSITTKDGYVHRGTANQIEVGKNADGTPKYKTVVNKFAVGDIYLLSEKGSRTKITRIVYGPVDSVRFKPDENQIQDLQAQIKSELTSSASAVQQSILNPSTTPSATAANGGTLPTTSTSTPPVTKIDIVPRDYFVDYDAFYTRVYYISGNTIVMSPDFTSILNQDTKGQIGNYGDQTREAIRQLTAIGYPVDSYRHKMFANEIDGKIAPKIETATFEEFFGTTVSLSKASNAPALSASALNATTLFDFYAAKGEALPSIAIRKLLYESAGLGKANLYTGTAEQNTKLLTYLQGKI